MPGRSESVAAVVNGLLVVLLPLAAQVAGSRIDLDSSDASVTANVPGSPRIETMISDSSDVYDLGIVAFRITRRLADMGLMHDVGATGRIEVGREWRRLERAA